MPPATTVSSDVLYTTSALLESFKIVPLAPQFLRDKLFPRVVEASTDQVAVEFDNGSQKLAPYCSRFSKGTAVPREKTQTSFFSPPFVKPIRNLTARRLVLQVAAPAECRGGDRDAELAALGLSRIGRR